MRSVALPLRQPSCVAVDKICGFQRQRNLYRELFLRQSLRVLRILREINLSAKGCIIVSRRILRILRITSTLAVCSRWRWNPRNVHSFHSACHAGCFANRSSAHCLVVSTALAVVTKSTANSVDSLSLDRYHLSSCRRIFLCVL